MPAITTATQLSGTPSAPQLVTNTGAADIIYGPSAIVSLQQYKGTIKPGAAYVLTDTEYFASPAAGGSSYTIAAQSSPAVAGTVAGDLSGSLPNPVVARSTSTTWGVFGVVPVARPAAYTLTFAPASSRTLPADTAVAPATTASTSATPFGYSTQAQADAIPAAIVALKADLDATKQVLKQVITDLQSMGNLQ